jgi:AAA domain
MHLELRQIAAALGGEISGDQVLAPGPGHSPGDRSLSVRLDAKAPDGFLVHSFAHDDPITCKAYVRDKCGIPAFKANGSRRHRTSNDVAALLREAVLQQTQEQPKGRLTASYDYADASGSLLYQVLRYEPKTFRQRRPDGNGGWIWKLEDRRVLYRLSELLEYPDATVLLTEGEKDADRIASLGHCATTVASGKWTAECAQALTGRDVWILEDNDVAGRKRAQEAAEALDGTAKSIRVVQLPGLPDGGDVSDWLDRGHTGDALIEACTATPLWIAKATNGAQEQQSSGNWNWKFHGDIDPVDSRPWLIELLIPETGTGLLSGQWGTYKSFVALDLAVAVITGSTFIKFPVMRRGGVLFIALEGESEIAIRLAAALEAKGFTSNAPFAWITDCPRLLDPKASEALTSMVKQAAERMQADFGLPVALVIVDTMGKAAGYTKSGDENDAVIARTAERTLAIASKATGAFFLGLDHFGKDPSTGTRGSSGKEDHTDVVLSLLGEKGQNGAVTDTRLCARKRRSGPNGEELPFGLTVRDMGVDARGTPVTTLTIAWKTCDDTTTKPKAKDEQWSKSLRLLRQTLMAMLVDCGKEVRPFADGPIVRAVDVEIVRREFYTSYMADGTEEQKAATRQKAFKRAVNDAQSRGLIGVRAVDGLTMVWLATTQEGMPQNA